MTSTESPIIKLFKLNDEYDKQLDGIPFNEIMTTLENRITEIDEKYKLKVQWNWELASFLRLRRYCENKNSNNNENESI